MTTGIIKWLMGFCANLIILELKTVREAVIEHTKEIYEELGGSLLPVRYFVQAEL